MKSVIRQLIAGTVFAVAYVLLDWASYLHPLYGLNITPWNPSLALGLVAWLRHGWRIAIPWFLAILIGEALIRGLPTALPVTLGLSAVLTVGYGAMAEALKRYLVGTILYDRRHLLIWQLIVVIGTLTTSVTYIFLLAMLELIPAGDWPVALVRFWVGDYVGIVVTMPFFWLLLEGPGQLRLLFRQWQTFAYVLLSALALWIAFGLGGVGEFQYFYLLFLPMVWAAARQGVAGAAIAAFALQAGIIVAVQWQNLVAVTVFELQMLGAVLAFVGLFIGAVVDEKQRVSEELRQTLRLAAAGDMAAALAHELNQPLTALSVYGAACQQMIVQDVDAARLRETIERMVAESHRAADVIRRLRDFFRTGATRLESLPLADLLNSAVERVAAKASQNGVLVTVAAMPECTLLADRLQLEVVLRNLLANALDAVAEQPTGRREIHVTAQRTGASQIRIRIEDSGLGLTPEARSRLFEPFRSSKASGLGLGLVISRVIAAAHGGQLTAESGAGGIFVLSLPIEGNSNEAC